MKVRSSAAFSLVLLGLVSVPGFAAQVDRDLALFEKFDQCSHNDSGRIATYDPETVDFAEEMAKLRAQNEGCMEGRMFSRSKTEGVRMMLDYIRTDQTTAACLARVLSDVEKAELIAMVRDRSNLGVLSSTGYSGDNGEACEFSHFWVYRPYGKVLQFTVNYTD